MPRSEFHSQPKAIHDEMNSTAFDEFGRMTANLGIEVSPGQTGSAERYPVSVREPGDGAHRCHQPAESSMHAGLGMTPIATGGRWHADLEDHPQRGGHAPDPLPPVRCAGAQPGHLGQHHHPERPHRVGLEGHRAYQPAARHHRSLAADHPVCAVRAAQ